MKTRCVLDCRLDKRRHIENVTLGSEEVVMSIFAQILKWLIDQAWKNYQQWKVVLVAAQVSY